MSKQSTLSARARASKPLALKTLLGSRPSTLGQLTARARRITELDERLARYLGPPLGDHLQVANVEAGRIVLQADSPTWASRAHYRSAEIRGFFDKSGQIQLDILTRPVEVPQTEATPAVDPTISQQTAQLLNHVADGLAQDVDQDLALADVLRKLARRRTPSRNP